MDPNDHQAGRTSQPLAWFDRVAEPLFGTIAAVVLFALMALTCADVVGRYFLNKPVYGAFELTEIALAALIFSGLPLVTMRQEHVTVDVLDAVTPSWMLQIQHSLSSLIAAAATTYLAWRLAVRGTSMLASGETTAQLLITLGYLTFSMAALMAVTALAFLVQTFRAPRNAPTGEV